MKKYLTNYLALIFIIWNMRTYSQICLSMNGLDPDPSSLLDLNTSDFPVNQKKGLLIPRVNLTGINDGTTIPSPATSLLVYNLGGGGLTPAGFYYNSGTPASPNWVKLIENKTAWMITGNDNINSSTHFIGTTNNQDLIFKTNNTENMRLTSAGNIGIGTTSPNVKLDINGSFALREGTAITLANGTNNDINITNYSFFRITGPTTDFSVSGFTGGYDGRIIIIHNTTNYKMTIINNSGSLSNNQILTLTGTNITTPNGPNILLLQYNATLSKWLVIGGHNIITQSSGTGNAWLIYTVKGF